MSENLDSARARSARADRTFRKNFYLALEVVFFIPVLIVAYLTKSKLYFIIIVIEHYNFKGGVMVKIAAICATQGEMGESLEGFSVEEEIQPKKWQKHKRRAFWGLIKAGEYQGGVPIVLARTGIWRTGLFGHKGNTQAREVVEFVVEKYKPEKILIFGTSGGLQTNLNTGDIVVCNPIYAEVRCPVWPFLVRIKSPISPDLKLYRLAREILTQRGVKFFTGGDLQTSGYGWPKKHPEVLVVEMEDYWIGSMAAEKKIPFLAVRIVLEPFGEKIIPEEKRTKEYQDWYRKRFLRVSAVLRDEFLIPFLQQL